MTPPEDELLARELGKVGASGGKRGSEIAKVAGAVGSLGGSLGGWIAARFLPTERYQMELQLPADARLILAKVYSFFASNGRVASDDEAGDSPYPKISGVVGSGVLKLNPAVLHAEIVEVGDDACTLMITGAAKEGLIKQQTAKAVQRLVESLRSLG